MLLAKWSETISRSEGGVTMEEGGRERDCPRPIVFHDFKLFPCHRLLPDSLNLQPVYSSDPEPSLSLSIPPSLPTYLSLVLSCSGSEHLLKHVPAVLIVLNLLSSGDDSCISFRRQPIVT